MAQRVLHPYRVLDLSGEPGHLCGKILGDLGADVIKVEPPCGDPGRSRGPFLDDTPDPNRSLPWWAFNTSKRSITLNLHSMDGCALFRRLVATADIVIETFPPGELERLGLGYRELAALRPGIILTSITPFGQHGPRAGAPAADLTCLAAGGLMSITGDEDRPPVRLGATQAYAQAGAQAACGTLVALWHRVMTGEGQHVDVSIQEAVLAALDSLQPYWFVGGQVSQRGSRALLGPLKIRDVWPCRDGHVSWRWFVGPMRGRRNVPLVQWMAEEGMAGDLSDVDWESVQVESLTAEQVERWEEAFGAFFLQHTVEEIYREARRRGIFLYPVYTARELASSEQLVARGFFTEVIHPELQRSIRYPGALYRSTAEQPEIRRRPPLIGEHNVEIYAGELGLTSVELRMLREEGAI